MHFRWGVTLVDKFSIGHCSLRVGNYSSSTQGEEIGSRAQWQIRPVCCLFSYFKMFWMEYLVLNVRNNVFCNGN